MIKLCAAMVACGLLSLPCCSAQESAARASDSMQHCPMHQEHADAPHNASVEKQGDQGMGFPHGKTTHHFRLTTDGGVIEVTPNDPNDKANTTAVRSHLSHIAALFRDGDFSTPTFIHDGVPPGTTTMKLMKLAIHYEYAEIPAGGRVRIASGDAVAVAAIHDFLRFQITEHQTGDSLEAETESIH